MKTLPFALRSASDAPKMLKFTCSVINQPYFGSEITCGNIPTCFIYFLVLLDGSVVFVNTRKRNSGRAVVQSHRENSYHQHLLELSSFTENLTIHVVRRSDLTAVVYRSSYHQFLVEIIPEGLHCLLPVVPAPNYRFATEQGIVNLTST